MRYNIIKQPKIKYLWFQLIIASNFIQKQVNTGALNKWNQIENIVIDFKKFIFIYNYILNIINKLLNQNLQFVIQTDCKYFINSLKNFSLKYSFYYYFGKWVNGFISTNNKIHFFFIIKFNNKYVKTFDFEVSNTIVPVLNFYKSIPIRNTFLAFFFPTFCFRTIFIKKLLMFLLIFYYKKAKKKRIILKLLTYDRFKTFLEIQDINAHFFNIFKDYHLQKIKYKKFLIIQKIYKRYWNKRFAWKKCSIIWKTIKKIEYKKLNLFYKKTKLKRSF
jgi:hypothetical protein